MLGAIAVPLLCTACQSPVLGDDGGPNTYFTINIHVEPVAEYCMDQTFYDDGKSILIRLANIAEGVGARLSIFSEYTFLYGALDFEDAGDNVLTDLIARGHSVGIHSHYGTLFQGNLTVIENACVQVGQPFSPLQKEEYVSMFEQLLSQVLGIDDAYSHVKAAYGAIGGDPLAAMVAQGLRAQFFETCPYPAAGSSTEHCPAIGFHDLSLPPTPHVGCPPSTPPDSSSVVMLIPAAEPTSYLSSIYANPAAPPSSCYDPPYANTATCGAWSSQDFELVLSAVEATIEQPNQADTVNTTGITFHVHNFSDESVGRI